MRRKQSERHDCSIRLAIALVALAFLASTVVPAAAASKIANKNYAQHLIESTLAKHAELGGMGIGTIPPRGHDCIDIADTDVREIGEKCDKGELSVMRTGKSVVEKEEDAFDVTVPLRVGGKIIGILSLDFKVDQQESSLLERAGAIAREVEAQIPSKQGLFDAAR